MPCEAAVSCVLCCLPSLHRVSGLKQKVVSGTISTLTPSSFGQGRAHVVEEAPWDLMAACRHLSTGMMGKQRRLSSPQPALASARLLQHYVLCWGSSLGVSL